MYELLKQGNFDNIYPAIIVTGDAHPAVLLQPQHFANATSFDVMAFLGRLGAGKYGIHIFPQTMRADMFFFKGENPLDGVPNHYVKYRIQYIYSSMPSVENIDSILQWTHAQKLEIIDRDDLTISLFRRVNEMRKLKQLRVLTLHVDADTCEEINVAAFINNLASLREIKFLGREMTFKQVEEFLFNNAIPASWHGWLQGRIVYPKRHN